MIACLEYESGLREGNSHRVKGRKPADYRAPERCETPGQSHDASIRNISAYLHQPKLILNRTKDCASTGLLAEIPVICPGSIEVPPLQKLGGTNHPHIGSSALVESLEDVGVQRSKLLSGDRSVRLETRLVNRKCGLVVENLFACKSVTFAGKPVHQVCRPTLDNVGEKGRRRPHEGSPGSYPIGIPGILHEIRQLQRRPERSMSPERDGGCSAMKDETISGIGHPAVRTMLVREILPRPDLRETPLAEHELEQPSERIDVVGGCFPYAKARAPQKARSAATLFS